MSETEGWKGTLKPTGKTVKEVMDSIETWPSYYDRNNESDVIDYFRDCYNGIKIELDGKVYNVDRDSLTEDDIFQATDKGDHYEFVVQYYNGACGFDEAIETAIKKIKREP